jgi:hypothetical protein
MWLFSRAYGQKYGHRAWLERQQKLEEQRAEAQELEEFRRIDEECRRRLGKDYAG